MRELIEMLRNTSTYMAVCPHPLGMELQFIHANNGDPKQCNFIITDLDIAALEISLEKYIMAKLELFLEHLGIKTHA